MSHHPSRPSTSGGDGGRSAGGVGMNNERRPSWTHQIQQMISQGRRNSAAKIIGRLREGSIPG
jgi:hypothetical protein